MTTPLFSALARNATARAQLVGAAGHSPRYWRELASAAALLGSPWREAERMGASPEPVRHNPPMATCYAIIEGEYSDYKVLAVFTTREKAESELPKYGNDAEIEEFPLDPLVPEPPSGMTGYCCGLNFMGNIFASPRTLYEMTQYEKPGIVHHAFSPGDYRVMLWARHEDHAIKIAAEKFARQKAIEAGIAL